MRKRWRHTVAFLLLAAALGFVVHLGPPVVFSQMGGGPVSGVTPPGVLNLTTAGQGGFFGVTIVQAASAVNTTVLAGANAVKAMQFVLPFSVTVRKVVSEVVTTSAGGLYSVGIYDAAATSLLLSSGAQLTTTATVISVTLGTPVLLSPGVYWLAWTGDNTTFTLRGTSLSGAASVSNMLIANANRVGGAANASVAGVLPAALGAITTAGLNIPAVWFEP